jgi:hypothetical protein
VPCSRYSGAGARVHNGTEVWFGRNRAVSPAAAAREIP